MKKYKDIQQGTPEWFHIKKGKVSGTGLAKILGTPYARKEFLYEIIAERLTVGIPDSDETARERGTRLESEGIEVFEIRTGKMVERVGLCESEKNSQMVNSPDGLIGDDEAIEIKCMGGKNHIKLCFENEVPKEYVAQTIQYFIVNEKLEILWFVGYNPDIPDCSLHILKITRKDMEEMVKDARKKEEDFIEEVNEGVKEIKKNKNKNVHTRIRIS